MGQADDQHRESIADCHACGVSLARPSVDAIEVYDQESFDWFSAQTLLVMNGDYEASDAGTIAVMRQMAVLLTSRFSTVTLHAHVCATLAVPEMQLAQGHISIESRALTERHHLVQLIAWLMTDLEPRLRGAWRAKAVRYNHMLKDFEWAPQFYIKMVDGFSNWRIG